MNINNFTFKQRNVPSAATSLFRKFTYGFIPFLLLFSVEIFAENKAKLLIINAKEPVLVGEDKCDTKLTIQGFEVSDACDIDFTKTWYLLDEQKKAVKNGTSEIGGSTFPASYIFTKKDFGKKFYLVYKAKDKCDNEDVKEFELAPRDMIKPKPQCYQGLSVDLMPTTSVVWLSASMFDANSTDECGEVIKDKINGISPINNHSSDSNQQLLGSDYTAELRISIGYPLSLTLPTTNLVYTNCIGFQSVRIWAIDAAGNYDYCDTYVYIQNNMNAPGGTDCWGNTSLNRKIGGTVKSINNKPLQYVKIYTQFLKIPNSEFLLTDINGVYSKKSFDGANFSLKANPSEFENPLNGVSTIDLLFIQKHILGIEPIINPFLLIAADVNNSGKITTSDIVELRKMILGVQKQFSNNQSWRFFSNEMKENVILNNLQKDVMVDFTGVKIGDINLSTAVTSRVAKTHYFNIQNKNIKAGETIELELGSDIDAFSFTLNYDGNSLELLNLDENSAHLERGVITSVQLGTPFKAIFKAKTDAVLSKVIELNSAITRAEAVINDESNELALQFEWEKNTATQLFQNQPNPFQYNTLINFFSSEVADYELFASDEIGRVVERKKGISTVGLNQIDISLQNAGTYFYTLKMKDFVATKKMIAW